MTTEREPQPWLEVLALVLAGVLPAVAAAEVLSPTAAVRDGAASAAPAAGADAATAAERDLQHKLAKLYPATRVQQVRQSPLPGVFEVTMGPNVAYVSADGRHFLFGHLYDMQQQQDLTALAKASGPAAQAAAPPPGSRVEAPAANVAREPSAKPSMADLPLANAIVERNGKGSRTLVLFSDPECPYCRRLDASLRSLDDVTIYTFLIPILGPRSQVSAEQQWARSVPARAAEARAVLQANLELARKLGVRGTPYMLRADGERMSGALPVAEIDNWLKEAPAPVAAATGGGERARRNVSNGG
ncbi:MAG: DsbC family protein [Burkholderiaceae bacterium]|nr:DsbC family protein [Aquabacterium sp.]NUP85814.1 DsbC family protein [Burkholderiaceae bacterium]